MVSFEDKKLENILEAFEAKSGLKGLKFETKKRDGGDVLVVYVANPTDRLFSLLEDARKTQADDSGEAPLATLAKKAARDILRGAEGKLLLKTLLESVNINRFSFQEDFLSRYTNSVAGAEEQVLAASNHIVFGRRGAGKSTLLLYALHMRASEAKSCVWVDMQVYARRNDVNVVSDVLREILQQCSDDIIDLTLLQRCLTELEIPDLSEESIRKLLPSIRRVLSCYASTDRELFIFLDDFHVLSDTIQPSFLDVLYAISRGNRLFLKVSAIQTLTRTFDSSSKEGLEIPHDAQVIALDYNLTMPDKATDHIEAILDSHAQYCGLPSSRRLCTSADVIPRLTWVAAGVPRDAVSLFAQAIAKATLASGKRVTVSNVNVAASENLNTKLRELEVDLAGKEHPLRDLLERIRLFCIKSHRSNAFLVEIKTDGELYTDVRKLVDLRLLHVINEGITIGDVGRKYLGLVLDYGFYTGIRAAKSVDLFNKQTKRVSYKELRKLPVFDDGD